MYILFTHPLFRFLVVFLILVKIGVKLSALVVVVHFGGKNIDKMQRKLPFSISSYLGIKCICNIIISSSCSTFLKDFALITQLNKFP